MKASRMSHLSGPGTSRTRSSPRNSLRYRRTSGADVESGDPRLTRRTARLGIPHSTRGADPSSSRTSAESDQPYQPVHVLGGYAVGDHGPRVVVSDVPVDAVLLPGANEVLHEVHPPARPHPTVVGVGIVRLDEDVVPEEDVAVEREVPERRETRRRIHQLVSNNQRHCGATAAGMLPSASHRPFFSRLESTCPPPALILQVLMSSPLKPVLLVIRDGWGSNPHPEQAPFNPTHLPKKPCDDMLHARYPVTLVRASGLDVGLPDGVMGNSEVGHENIGA